MEIMCLIFGAFMIAMEAFLTGLGFLFVGLAAITVGLLISFVYLAENDYMLQLAWFLFFVAAWAAVLWYPLNRFLRYRTEAEYSNIIGDKAVVVKNDLVKGKSGQVRWSGTNMTARIDNSAQIEKITVDSEVEITSIKGTLLRVKPIE